VTLFYEGEHENTLTQLYGSSSHYYCDGMLAVDRSMVERLTISLIEKPATVTATKKRAPSNLDKSLNEISQIYFVSNRSSASLCVRRATLIHPTLASTYIARSTSTKKHS